MKNFIAPSVSLVLISAYFTIRLQQRFGYQRIVPPNLPYRQNFRKTWGHVGFKESGTGKQIFADKNIDTIGLHTLKKATQRKSYSYDVAIVCMSPHWYSHSNLPRDIYCHSTNTSIVMRKATEDEDNIRRADVLIFANHHSRVPINWTKLQRLRHSGQLWVYTSGESPFYSLSNCPPRDMNISFNISSTYHPKADISVPYGRFIPFRQKQGGNVKSNFYEKTKLIVWVSSHCSTPMWRRSDFAHDLAKYLPLDTYGVCGTLNCPKHRYRKCKKLYSRYKFYLALENSCCGGYITEKFWDALTKFEVVPVVVGAPLKDYKNLAPNNSFIHADDFASMKMLADYILKVGNEKVLYDSYFQWKRSGKAKESPVKSKMAFSDEGVCRLIEYERSSSAFPLAYPPFDPYGPNWFGGCNECGEHEWIKNYSNFNEKFKIKKQKQNV